MPEQLFSDAEKTKVVGRKPYRPTNLEATVDDDAPPAAASAPLLPQRAGGDRAPVTAPTASPSQTKTHPHQGSAKRPPLPIHQVPQAHNHAVQAQSTPPAHASHRSRAHTPPPHTAPPHTPVPHVAQQPQPASTTGAQPNAAHAAQQPAATGVQPGAGHAQQPSASKRPTSPPKLGPPRVPRPRRAPDDDEKTTLFNPELARAMRERNRRDKK